jgi:hypothetical protein
MVFILSSVYTDLSISDFNYTIDGKLLYNCLEKFSVIYSGMGLFSNFLSFVIFSGNSFQLNS